MYAWVGNVFSVIVSTAQSWNPAMKKFCRQISPGFAWIIYISLPLSPTVSAFITNSSSFDTFTHDWSQWIQYTGVFNTTGLTHPPPLLNKDTVYFPALLESRTKKPPSLFWETTHRRIFQKFQIKLCLAKFSWFVGVNKFQSCPQWVYLSL